LDIDYDVKVAGILCLSPGQTVLGNAQLQTIIGSRRDTEVDVTFERRDLYGRAQDAFPGREIEIVKEI
jgi:hypothetical protein